MPVSAGNTWFMFLRFLPIPRQRPHRDPRHRAQLTSDSVSYLILTYRNQTYVLPVQNFTIPPNKHGNIQVKVFNFALIFGFSCNPTFDILECVKFWDYF